MTFTILNRKTKQVFEKYFADVREAIKFERKATHGDKILIYGVLFDNEEEEEEYDYFGGRI